VYRANDQSSRGYGLIDTATYRGTYAMAYYAARGTINGKILRSFRLAGNRHVFVLLAHEMMMYKIRAGYRYQFGRYILIIP